ncbi:MAG: chemoreceptor glutamine deamidase CheD [Beijerinckiaceae bacterium]
MSIATSTGSGRRYFDQRFNAFIINVAPGQFEIASGDGQVLSTVLGSCVAACIRDRTLGIGGMNHFLLPGEEGEGGGRAVSNDDMRIGSAAMEFLINGLIRKGACRSRMEAKVFGGARMLAGNKEIGVGERNIIFVRRFLNREGLPIISEHLGGERARRVNFEPISGRAWVQSYDRIGGASVVETEQTYRRELAQRAPANNLEVF